MLSTEHGQQVDFYYFIVHINNKKVNTQVELLPVFLLHNGTLTKKIICQ